MFIHITKKKNRCFEMLLLSNEQRGPHHKQSTSIEVDICWLSLSYSQGKPLVNKALGARKSLQRQSETHCSLWLHI
jgi:hypothetical protein